MLSTLLSFTSCKNNAIKPVEDAQTTSTTNEATSNNETTTEKEPTNSTETTKYSEKLDITGAWVYDEVITPQNFYTDFYNPEITKTNIEFRTLYEFNSNGTFSISISIANISQVRVEYRSLMVEGARKNIESKGDFLTPDDVLYYEDYADKILEQICAKQKGTYEINGNKIIYTTAETSFYETFILDETKLTLTGSSVSDEGYPLNLVKM